MGWGGGGGGMGWDGIGSIVFVKASFVFSVL